MINKCNKKQGFTLLELLAALGVFVIVFGILIGFIIWIYRSNIKLQVMREVASNTQRAMATMLSEVKQAESVYVPTFSPTQLSLKTLHYLPAGELFSYIDFFICGTQICFRKESQEPIALTSAKVKVDNLNFVLVNSAGEAPSVQIDLTVSYKNPTGKSEYEASLQAISTAALRTY